MTRRLCWRLYKRHANKCRFFLVVLIFESTPMVALPIAISLYGMAFRNSWLNSIRAGWLVATWVSFARRSFTSHSRTDPVRWPHFTSRVSGPKHLPSYPVEIACLHPLLWNMDITIHTAIGYWVKERDWFNESQNNSVTLTTRYMELNLICKQTRSP